MEDNNYWTEPFKDAQTKSYQVNKKPFPSYLVIEPWHRYLKSAKHTWQKYQKLCQYGCFLYTQIISTGSLFGGRDLISDSCKENRSQRLEKGKSMITAVPKAAVLNIFLSINRIVRNRLIKNCFDKDFVLSINLKVAI